MSEPLVLPRPGGWLAAAWHPAHGRIPVLVVQPPGPDLERCHRALARLGDRLAHTGHPTLRLDLGGSGDSAGDLDVASRAAWRDDAHEGLAELLRRTGAARAALVGLRLGALVACDAADHPAVAGAIAWEAPADGATQLAEWAAAERERAVPLGQTPRDDRVLGHPLGRRLRDDLATWSLAATCRSVRGQGGAFWKHDADAALVPHEALALVVEAVAALEAA